MAKQTACSNCGAGIQAGAAQCAVCGMPQGQGANFVEKGNPMKAAATRRPGDGGVSAERKGGGVKRGLGLAGGVLVSLVVAAVAVFILVRGNTAEPGQPAEGGSAAPLEDFQPPEPAPETVTQVAPEPAEPEVLPTASFTFHRTKSGYQDAFYVLGEVENTSPYAISKPELVIVMLDADGKEVGTDNGFALAEILEPGEKSYLSAIVTSPPAHASLKYEVVARKASYRPKEAVGLVIEAREPQPARAGLHKFSGAVKNGGERRARFLNVRVLAFDEQDKLLGVYSTYAKTDGLEPGKSARFQLTAVGLDDPKPARFEYLISGREVD